MCGIAGILSPFGIDPSQLKMMSDTLRHRGPDDEGFLLYDAVNSDLLHCRGDDTIPEMGFQKHIMEIPKENGFSLGLMHRRLSIIDLSANGHQPIMYKSDRYAIILNGEIYNYKEIREELLLKGYQFFSTSDTEVVVAAYDAWGNDAVQKFLGMWAFAIWDNLKKELYLSRDRFGIKPLYFYADQQKFAFSSEIKALFYPGYSSRKINQRSFIEYITYGTYNEISETLFMDVKSLPPGHSLLYDLKNHTLTISEYYNVETSVENFNHSFDSKDVVHSYRELFRNVIDLHLRSDVTVGSCLSGGLDSSSIVAFALGDPAIKAFKTVTASFPGSSVDETNYAVRVINHFQHIEPVYAYPSIETYWKDLESLIWHQDLPISSTSIYSQWEVMKTAADNKIKVLLDGQGADEVLGGYYIFAGIYLLEYLKKYKVRKFFSEKNKLSSNFSKHINTDISRALYHFLPDVLRNAIRKMNRSGIHYIAPGYSHLLAGYSAPEEGGRNYREFSINAIRHTLQDLLRYEDRNAMAFSVESRVPFLDHRLVEFSLALPSNWKIQQGFTKYILRKSSEPYLPAEVIWRKEKFGFLTPQQDWKSLSEKRIQEYVSGFPFPAILDKNYILKTLTGNIKGETPMSEFWKLISVLKWIELFKIEF